MHQSIILIYLAMIFNMCSCDFKDNKQNGDAARHSKITKSHLEDDYIKYAEIDTCSQLIFALDSNKQLRPTISKILKANKFDSIQNLGFYDYIFTLDKDLKIKNIEIVGYNDKIAKQISNVLAKELIFAKIRDRTCDEYYFEFTINLIYPDFFIIDNIKNNKNYFDTIPIPMDRIITNKTE